MGISTRAWTIAGYITGLLSATMFAFLTGVVVGSNPPMTPAFTLAAVVDILLGFTSIKLLTDARTVTRIETMTADYVHGVRDTVDRLAEALPKPCSDNIRRIG